MASAGGRNRDRSFVLWLVGGLTLLILLYSLFGPALDRNDPTPSATNTGSRGVRAASLLLPQLGYTVQVSDVPLSELNAMNAAHATLILAEPILPVQSLKTTQAAIAGFLDRGGRVLATGPAGAELLGGETAASTHVLDVLCTTTPEGQGALAAVGRVKIAEEARWSAPGPEFHVEGRCLGDAAIVSFRHGAGEAVWWSSPEPLTNAELRDDASLRLLLASVGPAAGRTVIFDEYLHTARESLGDTLKGLPLHALAWQLAAVFLLMLVSFGRRNGPLRSPAMVPRSSPVEFAESMGRLYGRGGATSAPIDAARGALADFLVERAGVSREMLRAEPERLPGVLAERFGGEWNGLAEHLRQASEASGGQVSAASALKLVQALEADRRKLEAQMGVSVEVGAP